MKKETQCHKIPKTKWSAITAVLCIAIALPQLSSVEEAVGTVFSIKGKRIEITGTKTQQLRKGQKIYIKTRSGQEAVAIVTDLFHSRIEARLTQGDSVSKGDQVFLQKPMAKATDPNNATELTPEYIRQHGMFRKSLHEKKGKFYISPTDMRNVYDIKEFPLIYFVETEFRSKRNQVVSELPEGGLAADYKRRERLWLNGLRSPFYDQILPLTFSADRRHYAYKVRQGKKWKMVADGRSGPLFDKVSWFEFVLLEDLQWYYFAEQDGEKSIVTNAYKKTFYDIALVSVDTTETGPYSRHEYRDRPTFLTPTDVRVFVKIAADSKWQIFSLAEKKLLDGFYSTVTIAAGGYRSHGFRGRPRGIDNHCAIIAQPSGKKNVIVFPYAPGRSFSLSEKADKIRSVERNPVYPDWVRYTVADDRSNSGTDETDDKNRTYLLNTRTGQKIGPVDLRAPFFSAKTKAVYYRDNKGDFLLSADGTAKKIIAIPDVDDSGEEAEWKKCRDDSKALYGSWLREGGEIDRRKGKLFWQVTEGCPKEQ